MESREENSAKVSKFKDGPDLAVSKCFSKSDAKSSETKENDESLFLNEGEKINCIVRIILNK